MFENVSVLKDFTPIIQRVSVAWGMWREAFPDPNDVHFLLTSTNYVSVFRFKKKKGNYLLFSHSFNSKMSYLCLFRCDSPSCKTLMVQINEPISLSDLRTHRTRKARFRRRAPILRCRKEGSRQVKLRF